MDLFVDLYYKNKPENIWNISIVVLSRELLNFNIIFSFVVWWLACGLSGAGSLQ